jgi:hypothetical protein
MQLRLSIGKIKYQMFILEKKGLKSKSNNIPYKNRTGRIN